MNAGSSTTNSSSKNRIILIAAGVILGIGQGGFFDGIVFHQLLQWHHMFSNIEPDTTVLGLELNTLGDGLFHVFDWLMTAIGIFLLWRAAQRPEVLKSSETLIGSLLIGAGAFNLVEGILDHQILGIHHVKPGPNELAWDLGFLAVGALLILVGWLVLRASQPEEKTT